MYKIERNIVEIIVNNLFQSVMACKSMLQFLGVVSINRERIETWKDGSSLWRLLMMSIHTMWQWLPSQMKKNTSSVLDSCSTVFQTPCPPFAITQTMMLYENLIPKPLPSWSFLRIGKNKKILVYTCKQTPLSISAHLSSAVLSRRSLVSCGTTGHPIPQPQYASIQCVLQSKMWGPSHGLAQLLLGEV